ncbi:uncharacterized protein LOC141854456 [Brevipalpus obovatus]|uniref:uncharacterized protein LOC141854456 n=1 Tax=Brevipalpus obovatus TaxID=246614 RepID=UPI003D9E7023
MIFFKHFSMKFCIILIFLTFSNVQAEFQCPSDAIDNFFPDPELCDAFWRCTNGQKFSFSCGPGTHFNPSIKGCDWPHAARCEERKAQAAKASERWQVDPSQPQPGVPNPYYPQNPNAVVIPTDQYGQPLVPNQYVDPNVQPQPGYQPTGGYPPSQPYNPPQAGYPQQPSVSVGSYGTGSGYPDYAESVGQPQTYPNQPINQGQPDDQYTSGTDQRPQRKPQHGDPQARPNGYDNQPDGSESNVNQVDWRRGPGDSRSANDNDLEQPERKWSQPQVGPDSEIQWKDMNNNNPGKEDINNNQRRPGSGRQQQPQQPRAERPPTNRDGNYGQRIQPTDQNRNDGDDQRSNPPVSSRNDPNQYEQERPTTGQRTPSSRRPPQRTSVPDGQHEDDPEDRQDNNGQRQVNRRPSPPPPPRQPQRNRQPTNRGPYNRIEPSPELATEGYESSPHPSREQQPKGSSNRPRNENDVDPEPQRPRQPSSRKPVVKSNDDDQPSSRSGRPRDDQRPQEKRPTQRQRPSERQQEDDLPELDQDPASKTEWYRPSLPPPPEQKRPRFRNPYQPPAEEEVDSTSPYYGHQKDPWHSSPGRRPAYRPVVDRRSDAYAGRQPYGDPNELSPAESGRKSSRKSPKQPVQQQQEQQKIEQQSEDDLEPDASNVEPRFPTEEERAKVMNELYDKDPYTLNDLMENLPCNETTLKDCDQCDRLKWLKFGKVALKSDIMETIASSPEDIVKDCFRRCDRIDCVAYTYSTRNGQCQLFKGPVSVDDIAADDDSVTVMKEPKSTLIADEWLFTENATPMGKDIGTFTTKSSIECLRACITVGDHCRAISFMPSTSECRLYDSINGERLALKANSIALQHKSIHHKGNSWRFSSFGGKKLNESLPLSSFAIQDEDECFEECLQTPECIFISIEGGDKSVTKECHLYSNLSPFVEDSEFNSYILKTPLNSSMFMPLPGLYFYGYPLAKEENVDERECNELAKSIQGAQKMTYLNETKQCFIFSDSAKVAVWKNPNILAKSSLINIPSDWRYLAFKRLTGVTLSNAILKPGKKIEGEKSALTCLDKCLAKNCSAVAVTYAEEDGSIECTMLKEEDLQKTPRIIFKPNADLFARILPGNLLPESKENQTNADHCSSRVNMPHSDDNFPYFEKEMAEKEQNDTDNDSSIENDPLETRSSSSRFNRPNARISSPSQDWLDRDMLPHGNEFEGMINEGIYEDNDDDERNSERNQNTSPERDDRGRQRNKRSIYAMTLHGASVYDSKLEENQTKDSLEAGAEAGFAIRDLISGSLGAVDNSTESILLKRFMARVSEETKNPKGEKDIVDEMKSTARKVRELDETDHTVSERKPCKMTRGSSVRTSQCRSNEMCSEGPEITHGDEKSLAECAGTRINSTCQVVCRIGYKPNQERIACEQIGKKQVWNTEGLHCEKDDSTCSELPWIAFKSKNERDQEKTHYLLKYDAERKLPIFAVYRYGKSNSDSSAKDNETETPEIDREELEEEPEISAFPCPQLKDKQLSHLNYKLSNYTKSQLASPMAFEEDDKRMSNHFVNTAPQDPFTKSGPWRALEKKLKTHLTNKTGFIVTGVCSQQIRTPATSMLPVPKCFWKIACTQNDAGEVSAATFYHENTIPMNEEEERARVEEVMSYTNQEFVKSLIGSKEYDSIWPEVLDRFSTSKSKTVNEEMMIIRCAASKKLEQKHIEFWNSLLTNPESGSPWAEGSENDLETSASEPVPVSRPKRGKCTEKVVAHVGLNKTRMEVEAVNASQITHLILNSAMKIAKNGSILLGNDTKKVYDRLYHMKALKNQNKDLKVLLGLGGWYNSEHFSRISKNSALQKVFIMDVLSFLDYWNLDGIEIMWQYPVIGGMSKGITEDKENMVKFLKNLKDSFADHQMRTGRAESLLLALTGPGANWILDRGYDLEKIIKNVDWINVMAFDFAGPWNSSWGDFTGPHAPLYFGSPDGFPGKMNVDAAIKRYICETQHPEKIVLGIGLFGRYWKNVGKQVDVAQEQIGIDKVTREEREDGDDLFRKASPLKDGKKGGLLSYDQIKQEWLPKSEVRFHNKTRTPYLWNKMKRTLISFENEESIKEKVEYASQKGLGGVMIWSLDMDDSEGSLMRAIADSYKCTSASSSNVQKPSDQKLKCNPLRGEKRWWTQYDGDGKKDRMCGKRAPLINGHYAICDPDDPGYSCCSQTGYCGSGPEFCECEGCIDFSKEPARALNESVQPSASVEWYTLDMGMDDSKPQCGNLAKKLPNGKTPICNPDDPKRHCCSAIGFCGTGPDFCECEGCINYNPNATQAMGPKNWFSWEDGPENAGRCGPTAPRIEGKVAGCDGTSSRAYCCGSNGYCGSGAEYCDCPKCVNFKKNPSFDWT